MTSERAILVTIQLDNRFRHSRVPWRIEDEAAELNDLARSAGCRVVREVAAKRHQPVAGTFLGEGKLAELAEVAERDQADLVVFNEELSPAQQRNIEDIVNVKTVDRTQIILDIFAQRAHSQEGKVQVELAQLRYLLPRLVGKGIMLSRLGGGIGTRGPGEQKLEVDRRRVRQRISRLGRELDKLAVRRGAVRARRKETGTVVVALVGYTNAGKTTLLNRLTGEASRARDQLFTTLDPLARRLRLPDGRNIVLTDTVGFLHYLPHHLVEAFKATLEETRDADLLLHVLDASHPLVLEHAGAVEEVLAELELEDKPIITVLNKQDLIGDSGRLAALERAFSPSVVVSATTGHGAGALLGEIQSRLALLGETLTVLIPADRTRLLSRILAEGEVLSQDERGGMTRLIVRLPEALKVDCLPYITLDKPST